MLGQCRIGSEGDCSDNVDVGSMRLGVDIYDMLVGATGVQLTEHVGYEITPGITYFKWYSRRGQYKICGDTECACTETRDGDGQPWCGEPDLSFAPCCRADCPCPASWNGQEGQHCGRTCQRNGACSTDRHVTPSGAASTRNLAARRFTVIDRVRYTGPYVYTVRWDDDPEQIFVTELHPRMFIPWPKNMPCPVPSSHPTRYEWTLDSTGLEDMTVTEELVEWLAQTRGYVHHPSVTSNNETPDSTTSATSTSHGKTIDRGGKRASEANDQGGKRVRTCENLPYIGSILREFEIIPYYGHTYA